MINKPATRYTEARHTHTAGRQFIFYLCTRIAEAPGPKFSDREDDGRKFWGCSPGVPSGPWGFKGEHLAVFLE